MKELVKLSLFIILLSPCLGFENVFTCPSVSSIQSSTPPPRQINETGLIFTRGEMPTPVSRSIKFSQAIIHRGGFGEFDPSSIECEYTAIRAFGSGTFAFQYLAKRSFASKPFPGDTWLISYPPSPLVYVCYTSPDRCRFS